MVTINNIIKIIGGTEKKWRNNLRPEFHGFYKHVGPLIGGVPWILQTCRPYRPLIGGVPRILQTCRASDSIVDQADQMECKMECKNGSPWAKFLPSGDKIFTTNMSALRASDLAVLHVLWIYKYVGPAGL